MPPSHHSSSHHSSSSRSSSSRSSSSRSHSSHSSSHHSYSTSSRSRSYSSSGSRSGSSYRSYSSVPPIRARINQPVGWTGSVTSLRHYRLKNHDYDYYPTSWTASDGKHYEEGYYDENGKYYRNLFVPGSNMMLVCEYCGNHMMYTCKEGELPECSGCGAQFTVDATDHVQDVVDDIRQVDEVKRKSSIRKWFVFAVILYVAGLIFRGAWNNLASRLDRYVYTEQEKEVSKPVASSAKDSVYVEEIGRTCYLDGEDWYDSATECWFWFNDEEAPYQWQYWYEGISSDYGDYGWMEFDMDSQQWYIEVREGDWQQLPDTYDTSGLWHFTDEYINPFE